MTPANLSDQLIRDEDEVLYAYKDSRGLWTIGVGCLIDRRGGGITREESRYLLANRIASKRAQLLAALPWFSTLDDVRQGALLNMAFNLGVAGLLTFTDFLPLMKDGMWQEAGEDLLDSLWYKQVGDRAKRLILQIQTGVWQ